MLDSDDIDFYIGEQQIKDQKEQSIEIIKTETLQNCALVKIENRRGHPKFHFEIDGRSYFYGIAGIRTDYKIVLRCQKQFLGKACNNFSFIAPLDLLKQIMQKKSSKPKYSKMLDISDPRVYDLKNYDVNSFDIGGGHKCYGTENSIFSKSNNKPENETNEVKFKLVKIKNRRGHPNFHFEIDGKSYFYGIAGIRSNYKIVLRCQKQFSGKGCNTYSFIEPLDALKQIMQDKSSKANYSKMLDISDPRVYDLKNYDLNSFHIGEGHKCQGKEIIIFSKSNNKPENEINKEKCKLVKIKNFRGHPNFQKCKLVKIKNFRGHPNFQFEIDGRSYFYGIAGIRTDYKIVLRCQKQFLGKACNNFSFIAPLDLLKQIMQKKSSKPKYSKMLDISDPRVYDLKNYDVNSFDIGGGHKCYGTENSIFSKSNNKPENETNEVKFKLVKIKNRRGHPNFHFEIDGKSYFYGIAGIRSNYKIVLRCQKQFSGKGCNTYSFIEPLDALKQIMQDKSSKANYSKMLDISDPRVYDLKNYDVNSFDIGEGHKCPGTEISIFSKSNNKPKRKVQTSKN